MGTIDPTMGTSVPPALSARVLFGRTRRDVLALLLGRPDARFYLREIRRAIAGGSGAVQRELKHPAVRSAEKRLGREVNPSLYPVKEFRKKLKTGAPFLKRVLAGPKLFIAGDERELERLAR